MAQQILSTNTFCEAKWVVSPAASDGTHTTIQAAVTAASAGDTVFIRSNASAYTENITLKAGVNLSAFPPDSSLNSTGNVIISGKCTLTGAGTVTISGIQLQTNSDFLLAVTGSAASVVNLNNCFLNCLNNTGISYSSSSGSSGININSCWGNLATTLIAYFANSSSSLLRITNSFFTNTGGSTTASTISSSGSVGMYNTFFHNVISTSGTSAGMTCNCVMFDTAAENTTVITHNATSSGITFLNCFIDGGSASAISVGAGATLSAIACQIKSSNTNAITGAGTINYTDLNFPGSSSLINTTTQTTNYTNLGKYKASGQPCFLATMTVAVTNAWGDNGTYTVVYNNSVFDQNSNYSTGTGVFTAPVAGKYLFTTTTSLSNTGGTAVANANIALVATSRTLNAGGTAYITTDPNGFITLQGCWIVDMAAGDTAKLQVNGTTTASTKTGTFYGAAGTSFTWFSGYLIS